MKKSNFIWLSGGLLAMMAGDIQAQTLLETIQKAVMDYPLVNAAKYNVAGAEADIVKAEGQHYPQIGLQTSANQYESGGRASRQIYTPTVNMNIWSGMRIMSEVEKAESLAGVASQSLISTQDDVVLQSAEAYLNWAKAKQVMRLAEENLQAHDVIYASIKKITDLDPGRRIDLVQAQVRLENAKIALASRRAEVKQTGERLNRFWPEALPEQPSGVDDFRGRTPSNLSEALTLLEQQHPLLAAARDNLEAATANIGIARSQYHPQVNFSASRQYNWATNNTEVMGQVTVNMPVFAGGSIDAANDRAIAERESAQMKLDDTRRVLQEKIAVAWEEFNVTQQRALLGRQQSEMAGQVVDGYKLQFEIAKRSLLDLLNVQNDQFNYRVNTVTNEFDHRIARFRLSAAMGQLSFAYGGEQINQPGNSQHE